MGLFSGYVLVGWWCGSPGAKNVAFSKLRSVLYKCCGYVDAIGIELEELR